MACTICGSINQAEFPAECEHPSSAMLPQKRVRNRGLCISETSNLPCLRLIFVYDTSARIGASTHR